LNVLSIFLDLGANVSLDARKDKNLTAIEIKEDHDIEENKLLKTYYPDLPNKMTFSEAGLDLFVRITNDINEHNASDQKKIETIFSPKKPIITYTLILLNFIMFFVPMLFNATDDILKFRKKCFKALESFIGKWRYLVVYLFSAVCGSLLSIMMNVNSASVGASGAIFGLLGALLYFGYHYRVYLGNVIKSQIIPVIVANLLLGFMMPGVDNAAHIGGLIGGLLMMIGVGIKYKSTTFERVNGVIVSLIYFGFLLYMGLVFVK